MIPHHYPIPKILLEIAKRFPEEVSARRTVHNPELRPFYKKLRDQMPQYTLSDEEIALIALLFERFLQWGKRVDSRYLADRLHPNSVDRLRVFQVIRKLVVKGLLDIRGANVRETETNVSPEDKFSLVRLVESEVLFREPFLQSILGDGKGHERLENLPFRSNREHLETWFGYVNALAKFRSAQSRNSDVDSSDEEAALRDAKTLLESRLTRTTERFPLQDMMEDESLDEKERDIVLYLLKEELNDAPCSLDEMVNLISADRFEQHRNRNYFDTHSKLVARGIVEVAQNNFFMMKRSEIRLVPDVSRRLISREPDNDRERLSLLLRGEDLLELVSPKQSFKDLILPAGLTAKLETAIQRYRQNVDCRLREWGIERANSNTRVTDRDEAPLLLLFSGASGTGKTFAAGAFAAQLGKDMLVTDISRLLSCFVGESEQNVHRLFHLFERAVRRLANPPILLLNECDQFLMQRGRASSSADRMYHQMQNLFLEAFESMRGILVATTNLAEDIDSAFSRRFHLKLEFPLPDCAGRTALWRIHLPESLPLAADVRIERLARDYHFSGGQIALTVRNAAISAAVRGGEVTMADLVDASETESSGARRVARSGVKVGFEG